MSKPDVKKIREMLLSETSSDGSILKRAGTSLSALCGYIERLERVVEQAQEIVSWSDGKEAYSGEVEIDALLIANLDAALDAADAEENNTCSPTL